jgi:hypothetical protein
MGSETTERVKRHRLARGIVRVEVEVPSAEDALAVRRFAQSRRQAAKRSLPARQAEPPAEPHRGSLEAVLARLPPTGLAALERFANALAKAATPSLIERASGMAAILEDAAERALTVAAIDGEGRGA